MTHQMNLFDLDDTPPHRKDREASRDAAVKMRDSGVWRGRKGEVFRYVRFMGSRGAACFEVERDLKLSHETASGALRHLVQAGALEYVFDRDDPKRHRLRPTTQNKVGFWRVP